MWTAFVVVVGRSTNESPWRSVACQAYAILMVDFFLDFVVVAAAAAVAAFAACCFDLVSLAAS